MGRTKKVGTTGRFGTRYGATVRKRIRKIESVLKIKHTCPSCNSPKVSRVSIGIWECSFCGFRFTGGSWAPETPGGKIAKRTAKRLAGQPEQ
ncbi:MAG: 50S ribosomal protein L37Ae [Candidatus Heimdallarchaeota archaeon]|nr:MAG: 50S ribosomal protein L37Ae [Candidatus Heimdallarchaeota archaeon]